MLSMSLQVVTEAYNYVYPVVKLLLSFAKITNFIQDLLQWDCIIIALPWGHVNAPVEFVIMKHQDTH